LTSGLHGVDLYTGSAIQTQFLSALKEIDIPADVGVVMIHGINPFGAAWRRRVNQDNVDLNRNFCTDFYNMVAVLGQEKALGYGACMYTESDWLFNPTKLSRLSSYLRLPMFLLKETREDIQFGLKLGQRYFETGLYYGGREPQLETDYLIKHIKKALPSTVDTVVHIDIRTGQGKYAQDRLLAMEVPDLKLKLAFPGRTMEVVGSSAPMKRRCIHSIGDISQQIDRKLKWISLVHKISSCSDFKLLFALRDENCWHHHNPYLLPKDFASPPGDKIKGYLDHHTKHRLLKAYNPPSVRWQRAALMKGGEVVRGGLAYLGDGR
jgi:hypothetical protein